MRVKGTFNIRFSGGPVTSAGRLPVAQVVLSPGLVDILALTTRQMEVQEADVTYWAVWPPSITNSLPVINDDSSEAKNSTP